MISMTKDDAAETFLGSGATEDDAAAFWEAFKSTPDRAHFDDKEQRDARAYIAYLSLGWDWPFDPIPGA